MSVPAVWGHSGYVGRRAQAPCEVCRGLEEKSGCGSWVKGLDRPHLGSGLHTVLTLQNQPGKEEFKPCTLMVRLYHHVFHVLGIRVCSGPEPMVLHLPPRGLSALCTQPPLAQRRLNFIPLGFSSPALCPSFPMPTHMCHPLLEIPMHTCPLIPWGLTRHRLTLAGSAMT